MTGLETFALGLFTNGSWDILKSLFGASFLRLKNLFDEKNEDELLKTLEIIIEGNEELKNKLEQLQLQGDNIKNYYFYKDSNPKGNFGDNGNYYDN